MSTSRCLSTMAIEFEQFEFSCEQVKREREKNGGSIDVPVGVITARNQIGYSEQEKDSWVEQQHSNVCLLSKRWIHVVHKDATHGNLSFQWKEISELINRVRALANNELIV
eukprot:TRINITY_DN5937_c0_g1_i1.p1 TRINITY_DN5937_c0_g1~~TRINITY_DN5937_c0_g1_i1.p1  ORF type:complete len:121 (-),score=28.24 TRINITY_DN5937_c0_g1_i1:34-366(-)